MEATNIQKDIPYNRDTRQAPRFRSLREHTVLPHGPMRDVMAELNRGDWVVLTQDKVTRGKVGIHIILLPRGEVSSIPITCNERAGRLHKRI